MKRDDKWQPAAEMVRAIRLLQQELDENGLLTDAIKARSDNAIYGFLASVPDKVREEVAQG